MINNSLDICHVNVRSLTDDRINAIKAELISDYDLICLTETNLPHARVTDLTIQGFHNIMNKDRVGKSGGGVAVYAAENIGIERLHA